MAVSGTLTFDLWLPKLKKKKKKDILLVALATVQLHFGEQILLEALVGRELPSRLRV